MVCQLINVQKTYSQDKTQQSPKEVKIGSQVWMSQNLDTDKFNNGDAIPQAKTAAEWVEAAAKKTPAWCYYENDSNYGLKYGKLYNFYAVNDPRGMAPKGWHIPTEPEFTALVKLLGNAESGLKLKGISGWGTKAKGTNESGFNALPGGERTDGAFGADCQFMGVEVCACFWTATPKDST